MRAVEKKNSGVIYLSEREFVGRRGFLLEVIREHESALKRFLRVRLANEPDREDIAQEVYVRLCRQEGLADKLSFGPEKTRAYLFTIATNLIRDMARRSATRKVGQHDHLHEEECEDEMPSAEDRLQSRQELTRIRDLIGKLDPKCRRAFLFSRLDNMSYREIADEMEISVSMVEKHISRALARIRPRIEQD